MEETRTSSTIWASSGHPPFEAMTVDTSRAGPGVAGLEHETTLDRQVKQVGQLAVFLGVAPDQEDILAHGLTPLGTR
jgi:hypothetical protein